MPALVPPVIDSSGDVVSPLISPTIVTSTSPAARWLTSPFPAEHARRGTAGRLQLERPLELPAGRAGVAEEGDDPHPVAGRNRPVIARFASRGDARRGHSAHQRGDDRSTLPVHQTAPNAGPLLTTSVHLDPTEHLEEHPGLVAFFVVGHDADLVERLAQLLVDHLLAHHRACELVGLGLEPFVVEGDDAVVRVVRIQQLPARRVRSSRSRPGCRSPIRTGTGPDSRRGRCSGRSEPVPRQSPARPPRCRHRRMPCRRRRSRRPSSVSPLPSSSAAGSTASASAAGSSSPELQAASGAAASTTTTTALRRRMRTMVGQSHRQVNTRIRVRLTSRGYVRSHWRGRRRRGRGRPVRDACAPFPPRSPAGRRSRRSCRPRPVRPPPRSDAE